MLPNVNIPKWQQEKQLNLNKSVSQWEKIKMPTKINPSILPLHPVTDY